MLTAHRDKICPGFDVPLPRSISGILASLPGLTLLALLARVLPDIVLQGEQRPRDTLIACIYSRLHTHSAAIFHTHCCKRAYTPPVCHDTCCVAGGTSGCPPWIAAIDTRRDRKLPMRAFPYRLIARSERRKTQTGKRRKRGSCHSARETLPSARKLIVLAVALSTLRLFHQVSRFQLLYHQQS